VAVILSERASEICTDTPVSCQLVLCEATVYNRLFTEARCD